MKTVLLGDVANVKNGKSNSQDAEMNGHYPFFDRSQSIKRSPRYLFDQEAVILPGEGKEFIPRYYDGKFDLHQRAYAIWPKDSRVSTKYLYYLILALREYFARTAVGSTVKSLRKPQIEGLKFTLPSSHEQSQASKILGNIDEKIELNRRMNETLEKIGQTLFKHYFINNSKSNNWKLMKIGELVNIKGGGTPSTKNPDFWNGSIAWTSPRDLTGKNEPFLLDTDRKITTEGLSKISSGLLPAGTLLLSSRAPIGYISIAGLPLAINQGYIAFLPDGKLSSYFMHFWLKHNMERIKGAANGSTFMEISKTSFRRITIKQPDDTTLKEFDNLVSTFFEKIKNNQMEKQTLINLRDSLLPRLISGKIEV